MKIALPSDGVQVDAHFGHCRCFVVFEIDEQQQIVGQETLTPPPGCGCKSNIIPQLTAMGVSLMLAGNMGGGAVNLLTANGIRVVRGCAGGVREVVEAWLAGKLRDSGAGCQAHHSGECSGHG